MISLTSETFLGPEDELLDRWHVGDDIDVVIVGDGSGTTKGKPCGWAATVILRTGPAAGQRKTTGGGMNTGTCNVAEIMPYIQALNWLATWREQHELRGPVKVAIVTDCEMVAFQGNRLVAGLKSLAAVAANAPLWHALMAYHRDGYSLRFIQKNRSTSALNSLADAWAGNYRHAISAVDPPVDANGDEISSHHCNPKVEDPDNPIYDVPKAAPKRRRRDRPRNSEARADDKAETHGDAPFQSRRRSARGRV